MNANEISKSSQINRIQRVSGIFRTIFFSVAILCILGALALIPSAFLVKSQSKFELVSAGTGIAGGIWAWFCYKLFNLCSHGDLFTSKVVSYIRRVGYAYFLVAIATSSMWMLSHYGKNDLPTAYHHHLGFLLYIGLFNLASALFPGFLIIFIAWVMDEGRKIREEQELTV